MYTYVRLHIEHVIGSVSQRLDATLTLPTEYTRRKGGGPVILDSIVKICCALCIYVMSFLLINVINEYIHKNIYITICLYYFHEKFVQNYVIFLILALHVEWQVGNVRHGKWNHLIAHLGLSHPTISPPFDSFQRHQLS